MDWLADTNILLRLIQTGSPHHPFARIAIGKIRRSGGMIYVVPQNLVEFWGVATRPIAVNGLGFNPGAADRAVRMIERMFPLLADNGSIHPEWRRLVVACGVSGRQVHDARLVAAMVAHGVDRILTFNGADFGRYPGISAIDPIDVAGGP